MREQIKSQNRSIIQDYKKLSCLDCSSKNVIKWGKRKTENRGKVQRYKCSKCKKTFVKDDGFKRMRNHPKKITLCLDLFFKGISTRQIQEHLNAFYPHNSSNVSIYKWIIKYSKLIGKFVDKLKINNSESITFDELEYKTKGKQGYFIDVMDMKTRYMLSGGYYASRGLKEMKEVLGNAKKKSNNKTTKFYTDGLLVYPRALRKTYNYNKRSKEFKHKVTTSGDKSFNWKIERLHNSIRQRTKTFRGFHGSIESANSIMKGFEIFYNFIRKHQGIGKCPYELAVPNLQLKGNKWLELIERGAENGMRLFS